MNTKKFVMGMLPILIIGVLLIPGLSSATNIYMSGNMVYSKEYDSWAVTGQSALGHEGYLTWIRFYNSNQYPAANMRYKVSGLVPDEFDTMERRPSQFYVFCDDRSARDNRGIYNSWNGYDLRYKFDQPMGINKPDGIQWWWGGEEWEFSYYGVGYDDFHDEYYYIVNSYWGYSPWNQYKPFYWNDIEDRIQNCGKGNSFEYSKFPMGNIVLSYPFSLPSTIGLMKYSDTWMTTGYYNSPSNAQRAYYLYAFFGATLGYKWRAPPVQDYNIWDGYDFAIKKCISAGDNQYAGRFNFPELWIRSNCLDGDNIHTSDAIYNRMVTKASWRGAHVVDYITHLTLNIDRNVQGSMGAYVFLTGGLHFEDPELQEYDEMVQGYITMNLKCTYYDTQIEGYITVPLESPYDEISYRVTNHKYTGTIHDFDVEGQFVYEIILGGDFICGISDIYIPPDVLSEHQYNGVNRIIAEVSYDADEAFWGYNTYYTISEFQYVEMKY